MSDRRRFVGSFAMGLAVLGATAAIVLMGRRKKSQAKSNEEITVDNADADDAVDDQDNEAGVEAQTPPASVPLDGAPAAVPVANEQQRPDSSSEPLRCDVEAANECKKYGNEAMQRGDLETAVAQYSAALEHHPNHVIARNNRSAAYLKLHHWHDAESDATVAIECLQQSFSAAYNPGASTTTTTGPDEREEVRRIF